MPEEKPLTHGREDKDDQKPSEGEYGGLKGLGPGGGRDLKDAADTDDIDPDDVGETDK